MSYKILIVEDQEMAARHAAITIKRMGYEVAGICYRGEEAIEFMKNSQVDLVLMDVMLPGGMDGIETAAEVHKLNAPVLFVTALESDEVLERVKEVNGYGYLLKPYTNGDFKRSIETAVNLHQLRNKLRESEERYKAVIDDQLEMVCRFAPKGDLSFYNRSFNEFFNPEADLKQPSNINRHITIKDREQLNKSLGEITPESPISNALLRIVRGVKICWLEFVIRGFFDATGKVVEYQAVAREISDKVMAEESLKKVTDRYHLISEMTSDFIYTGIVTKEPGIMLDWITGPYAKLTGWSFDDYRSFPQGMLSIVHPDDQAQFPVIYETLLKNKPFISIYRVRTKNGEWLWFRDYARPVWDEYERKVTRVIGAVQNITEFKKTEFALKESEERLKFALSASVDGYWDWDIAKNKFFISARSMEMFGKPAQSIEINAPSAENLVHPDDRERFVKIAYEAMTGEIDDLMIEGKFLHATEGYRYILSRGNVVRRDSQGKPIRIAGVHIDVTDCRNAEKKLKRSEEKFDKVFSRSPIMMSISTLDDGRYIDVNDTFLSTTGFSREEVIGKTALDIGVWKDFSKREEMKCELLKNGSVRAGSNRMRMRDGEILDVIHSIEILEIDGEKHILSSIMDLTEFNKEKEQRSFVEETLKAVMDASPVGVGYQIDRKIIWVNDKFCQLTGYSRAELIGRSAQTAYATDEEFVRTGQEAYHEDGSARKREYEVQWKRKDGAIRDFYAINCQVNPLDPSQGYVFIIIDITDSKQGERDKNRVVNEKLAMEIKQSQSQTLLLEASKFASVGAVIGSIIHELNQPLNAIKTGSEGLLSWNSRASSGKSKLPKSAVSVLNSFSDAVDRIEEILAHLNAYRRNAKTMAISKVNINDCILESLDLLKERLLTHRVDLELALHEEAIEVKANSMTFELIVSNLLNYLINLLDRRPIEKKKILVSTTTMDQKAIASIKCSELGRELPRALAFDSFRNELGVIDIEPEIIKMYVEQFGGVIKLNESPSGSSEVIIELELAQ